MNTIIARIITGLGVFCFVWFIVCFIMYGWSLNEANNAMGIMGSVFIVGGLNLLK